MAVKTGVLSSATAAQDLYNLIAADLGANPNWSRPVDPTLTGVTDSYTSTHTSQVWKNVVGSNSWHLVLSYDSALPNELRVTFAEKYGAADGAAAKRFRRIPGGGALGTASDTTSVTPATTDIVSDADAALSSTNPNFAFTKVTLGGSGFPYLFKVGNKDLTIGVSVAGVNRWVKVGAFESLVTGPPDPMPVAMFTHGINNLAQSGATLGINQHADGVVTRNPGLGTTAETGAFFAQLSPLHAPTALLTTTALFPNSACSFGSSIPRWYTKTLMSQAVIHQSRSGGITDNQTFRGYYPDLFAGIINGTTEPVGGGADSVIIDGVTYYWLGLNCPGVGVASIQDQMGVIVAVRAD